MSYQIIFETKIVKMPDGKIIHFDRSGCNNDDAGRSKDEFTGKIYENEQAFISYAEKFKQDYDAGFELKIGSKEASYNDYYKHLIRMLKRGKSLEDFGKTYHFYGYYCDTVDVYEPQRVTMTAKEFSENFYKLLNSGSLRYRQNRIRLDVNEMDKIINRLENNESICFMIKSRKK